MPKISKKTILRLAEALDEGYYKEQIILFFDMFEISPEILDVHGVNKVLYSRTVMNNLYNSKSEEDNRKLIEIAISILLKEGAHEDKQKTIKFNSCLDEVKKCLQNDGFKLINDCLVPIDDEVLNPKNENITLATGNNIIYSNEAITKLKEMLANKDEKEQNYQNLIKNHPWMLGSNYSLVEGKKKFDDENIPDFTAVRAHDKFRDIIEIKQPFLKLFRENRDFTSDFNDSWNQIERYLNFARENKDYLMRNKGLKYDNPKCILIIGFDLTSAEKGRIRNKEKMNPAITVLTYNALIDMAENALKLPQKSRI